MGPYLKQMTSGVFSYSRKGEEKSEIRKAFRNLDVPRGANAGDSAMVLDYLHSLDRAGSFQADLVLLHVGAHDIKRDLRTGRNRVTLADYRKNVAAIIAWFKKRHIRLVWIRNGPLDETLHNARCRAFQRFEKDLDEYNRAAEILLKRQHVPILDLPGFTRTLGPMKQLLKDHIHFKDEIVRLQAAYITGWLMSAARRGCAPNRRLARVKT
ncbi:MAG: hypothetical protein HY360_06950 [Verrucomicrobia bacterium]|nr:hypothetical protein [Verrucomicrobiota bacterium]